jgi:hypothetical protein
MFVHIVLTTQLSVSVGPSLQAVIARGGSLGFIVTKYLSSKHFDELIFIEIVNLTAAFEMLSQASSGSFEVGLAWSAVRCGFLGWRRQRRWRSSTG